MATEERDRVVALEGQVTHLRADLTRAEREIEQLKGMEARLSALIMENKKPPFGLHDIGEAVQSSVTAAMNNLRTAPPTDDAGGDLKSNIRSALTGRAGSGAWALAAAILVLAFSLLIINPQTRHFMPFFG